MKPKNPIDPEEIRRRLIEVLCQKGRSLTEAELWAKDWNFETLAAPGL